MKPIARWNPARDVWEVPETEGLLCEHLDVFSETFPNSGTWADGMAYELPTSAPHTDGSASLSRLTLPTPSASDGNGGRQRSAASLASGKHQANLTDLPRLLSSPPR